MAAQWIFGQEVGYDSQETIEARVHVGRLDAGVNLQMISQTAHDSLGNSLANAIRRERNSSDCVDYPHCEGCLAGEVKYSCGLKGRLVSAKDGEDINN